MKISSPFSVSSEVKSTLQYNNVAKDYTYHMVWQLEKYTFHYQSSRCTLLTQKNAKGKETSAHREIDLNYLFCIL